jgi:hypothetical protein
MKKKKVVIYKNKNYIRKKNKGNVRFGWKENVIYYWLLFGFKGYGLFYPGSARKAITLLVSFLYFFMVFVLNFLIIIRNLYKSLKWLIMGSFLFVRRFLLFFIHFLLFPVKVLARKFSFMNEIFKSMSNVELLMDDAFMNRYRFIDVLDLASFGNFVPEEEMVYISDLIFMAEYEARSEVEERLLDVYSDREEKVISDEDLYLDDDNLYIDLEDLEGLFKIMEYDGNEDDVNYSFSAERLLVLFPYLYFLEEKIRFIKELNFVKVGVFYGLVLQTYLIRSFCERVFIFLLSLLKFRISKFLFKVRS